MKEKYIERIIDEVSADDLREMVTACNSCDGGLNEYVYWDAYMLDDFYNSAKAVFDALNTMGSKWGRENDFSKGTEYFKQTDLNGIECVSKEEWDDILYENKEEIVKTFIDEYLEYGKIHKRDVSFTSEVEDIFEKSEDELEQE